MFFKDLDLEGRYIRAEEVLKGYIVVFRGLLGMCLNVFFCRKNTSH